MAIHYNKINNTKYYKKKDKLRKQKFITHKSIKTDGPNKET